jgi:hypothetical protein
MATRRAECSCGQLRADVDGDPIRVSICHCLACQRRTGSAFGVSARFYESQVRTQGNATEFVRTSDDGDERTFSFCPECGATVFYRIPALAGMIAIPVGAFADPGFPPPVRSIYEFRKHAWVSLPDGIEHDTE